VIWWLFFRADIDDVLLIDELFCAEEKDRRGNADTRAARYYTASHQIKVCVMVHPRKLDGNCQSGMNRIY